MVRVNWQNGDGGGSWVGDSRVSRDVRTNDPGTSAGHPVPKTFSLGCFLVPELCVCVFRLLGSSGPAHWHVPSLVVEVRSSVAALRDTLYIGCFLEESLFVLLSVPKIFSLGCLYSFLRKTLSAQHGMIL